MLTKSNVARHVDENSYSKIILKTPLNGKKILIFSAPISIIYL